MTESTRRRRSGHIADLERAQKFRTRARAAAYGAPKFKFMYKASRPPPRLDGTPTHSSRDPFQSLDDHEFSSADEKSQSIPPRRTLEEDQTSSYSSFST